MFTALAACQTILTAIGSIAGPDIPPILFFSIGLFVLISILIPRTVFISERASAPSASTDFAISAILVTFGDSLTTRGFLVACLTCLVIPAAPSHVAPKAIPPCLTLGQEILSSIM